MLRHSAGGSSLPDMQGLAAWSSFATPVRLRQGRYIFKRATSAEEFEQLHRLNYETFVREIPQHDDPGTDALVDKFHDKNVYFIALRDGVVAGMVAVHDRPPFSIAARLSDPRVLRALGDRLLETRLLAIRPSMRHGLIFAGLCWMVCEYARAQRYSHLLISGLRDRQALYERLGFRALGDAVRSGDAWYVPMVLPMSALPPKILDGVQHMRRNVEIRTEGLMPQRRRAESFLPGPVRLADPVRRAFARTPVSHRGEAFARRYARVRRILSELTGGPEVAILCGSGTLANDAVAAALAADRTTRRGVVLVNGEFGRRLVMQARRFGLDFGVIESPWGVAWDLSGLERTLRADPTINWVWAVHLETSTGMVNNLSALIGLAAAHPFRLCLDCVSSLGAVPLDLRGVHLASGVSGKSLGGVAGLAIVLAAPGALARVERERVPTYLDACAAIESPEPRFTYPSPQLMALDAALDAYAAPARRAARFERYARVGAYVRQRLRDLGVPPLVDGASAAPVVATFRAGGAEAARRLLDECARRGFELHGRSAYLNERGLVQIATMGAVELEDCRRLFDACGADCIAACGRASDPPADAAVPGRGA